MDDKRAKLCDEKTLTDWCSLCSFYSNNFSNEKVEWTFRGENPESTEGDLFHIPQWAFKSRLVEDFDRFGIQDANVRSLIEQRLIRHFRRKAPIHTGDRSENWLECLALIQHYEGPTRMLDWTYSFFAAVYFAINRAKVNRGGKIQGVVWALDSTWLADEDEKFEGEFIDKHTKNNSADKLKALKADGRDQFENRVIHSFITNRLADSETECAWPPFVYAVNPYYLNERLSSQQGVLICPSRIDMPWSTNLQSMLRKSQQEGDARVHLWKIQIECGTVEMQMEFLKRLLEMNISQASLFPDLEGLAKSLRIWMIKPYIMRA